MQVACLGDVLLDILVDAPGGLRADDDVPALITFAPGGQAANVAAWVQRYGGGARLFGPRAADGPASYVPRELVRLGVEVHGPAVDRPGTVVSLLGPGTRSMASDPGSDWLRHVQPGPWLTGADWLFVSGYALLRSRSPERLVSLAERAHADGTRVAVDLASAAMIRDYGADRFRRLWQALEPEVVLANEQEWAATHATDPENARSRTARRAFGAGGRTVLVLKQGAAGCSFVIDGVADHRAVEPGPVRDTTGAGDALTAGFLLGGPDLAMRAAAECLARVGANPQGPPAEPR